MQCLINLLSNAVKYTETGEVAITGTIYENAVEVVVEDTGIGIGEDDLARVFGAFERIDSHLRVTTSGTGLGLYVTSKIVTDVLGGHIQASSRPGVGSRFSVSIPRVHAQAVKADAVNDVQVPS